MASTVAVPIEAACSREYTAVHSSGERAIKRISLIVLHSTEGATAAGAASWFENPESGGSAHLVVDDTICYRCLDNTQIPWAAQGANTQGFHIEQAGYARWGREQWLRHDLTLRRAAYKTALHARVFSIPLRWVGPVGLKLRRSGITTHADCTKAFGGTHTDPGVGYPKDTFLEYAKQYLAEMNV